LYREATVLALLVSSQKRDAKYSGLVKEYERLILPTEKPTPEGTAKAAALDAAMKDITELIQRARGMNCGGRESGSSTLENFPIILSPAYSLSTLVSSFIQPSRRLWKIWLTKALRHKLRVIYPLTQMAN
jgi:hypothetical protein